MHDPSATPVAPADRPPDEPADRRPWYRHPVALAVLVAAGLVLGLATIAFATIYATADIPSPDELVLPEPSVVYDGAGEQVATLKPGAVEGNVALADLPDHVPAAVLAAEDRSFHDHGGFSTTGILRAAWANLTSGAVVQGASTIDQQYVSIAVAEIDDSLTGKFREVAVAAKLDDEVSKDRILEMYLNAVPYGRGVRGIEAAARTYFDKPAVELDVNEAATLAGIIAAPSAYDPDRNPEDARARRDYVLRGMVETGALAPDEAEAVIASPLPPTREDPLVEYGDDAYFLDIVRDVVPELLDDPGVDPYSDLAIHTTLNRGLQAVAVETLQEQLAETEHSGALVTISPQTGAVRAAVGGLDYATQEFNVAVEGSRQAGSSFKPFALAAFVEDGGSPASSVHAPQVLDVPDGAGGETEIHNYTQRGYGTVSLHQATVQSMNTAYVNLATELGYDRVVDMAHSLGIDSELKAFPSTVLGTNGVNVVEMASAYATFAAEGVHHDAHVVTRIETLAGEVLYEWEGGGEPVIEPNTAAVVSDVLTDVVSLGTGTAAALEDRPVAGKTGTTNDYRDAWFVGYTPELATAVWVGNLDNSPMDRVTGGSYPATVWSTYMAEVLRSTDPSEFPEPDLSVLEVRDIDGVTDARDEVTPTEAPEPSPAPAPSPAATPTEPTESPEPTGSASEPDGGASPTTTEDGPVDVTEEPAETTPPAEESPSGSSSPDSGSTEGSATTQESSSEEPTATQGSETTEPSPTPTDGGT
ncbi:MAG: penicillin-binding protein [Actinobacteria bacterium]|nr:penicillin-binding protein [Actinomycetota bacterium]